MIVYKKGDLLKSEAHIIVHGCNCFHVMGAGVAQLLKSRWSYCYEADRRTPHGEVRKLGTWSGAGNYTPLQPYIVNLYTQHGFNAGKRPLHYGALRVGMENLAAWIDLHDCGEHRVAMPKIGAGLAGGEWEYIERIINESFKDREVEVWVYDPRKN